VTFNDNEIATLTPGVKHAVKFVMDLAPGTHGDTVQIHIDGKLVTTGSSWKYYYQNDQEQAESGNKVPVTNCLLFQARGTGDSADQGKGYLIDSVQMAGS